MKTRFLLAINAVYLFLICASAGASVAGYNYTLSANLYDFEFVFYEESDLGYTKISKPQIQSTPGYSESVVRLDDQYGNNIIHVDDPNDASATGPAYALNASSDSNFVLSASVGTDGGTAMSRASNDLWFTSPIDAFLKINFSYDLNMNSTDAVSHCYASVSVWDLDSNTNHYFDTSAYEEAKNQSRFIFMPVFANKDYNLYAETYAYTDTDLPLHTPVPGAVLLLGSGLLGLAGFSRRDV